MARRRGLTEEDREIWSHVARTATPINPARPFRVDAPTPPPLKTPDAPRAEITFDLDARPVGSVARKPHNFAPTPSEQLAAGPVRMDHRTHKQMTRGKLRPEARLDLHGLTLNEAGPELARFVMSCHSRGLRLVLVITGKGSRGADHGPLPTRPGALRHQVPFWLHRPPMAQIVQQVVPAHLRHGGSGAYYVYLRR